MKDFKEKKFEPTKISLSHGTVIDLKLKMSDSDQTIHIQLTKIMIQGGFSRWNCRWRCQYRAQSGDHIQKTQIRLIADEYDNMVFGDGRKDRRVITINEEVGSMI